jgi:GNAT superfamily N-acetyltransferase
MKLNANSIKPTVRLAELDDAECIGQVLESGRLYLYERGLPQWQDGCGPTRLMAEHDINKGEGYVLDFQGAVCGYAALTAGVDDCYTRIDGAWAGQYPAYLSIHRMAIGKALRGQGFSGLFMQSLIDEGKRLGYRDIRVDTFPGNDIMIKVIENAGFIYRGIITFPIPNGERRAYQILV